MIQYEEETRREEEKSWFVLICGQKEYQMLKLERIGHHA